jgi:tetratricopeptide (TPR) repeat protein
LKIAREIGDRWLEVNHLGSLGNAYRDLGETKKAIDYYEKAFEINPEDGTECYNKVNAKSLMDKKVRLLCI